MPLISLVPFPLDFFVFLFPVIIITKRNLYRYYFSEEYKEMRRIHPNLKLNPDQAKIFNLRKRQWLFQGIWSLVLALPVA